ncbi:MAG: DUF6599 family protein [bacterium]
MKRAFLRYNTTNLPSSTKLNTNEQNVISMSARQAGIQPLNNNFVRIKYFMIAWAFLSLGIARAEYIEFPVIEGWKKAEIVDVYNPDNLWNIINGAADNFLSYDFRELQVMEYTNPDDNYIRVEVYHHKDKANAFGIYSQERPKDGNYINIGAEGYQVGSTLNFLAGEFYVKISSHDEAQSTKDAVKSIAEKLASELEKSPRFPLILNHFPENGKIERSEQYISKNFLGFGFLHSAFTCEYEIEGNQFRLFVIELPEPEAAQKMLGEYLEFTDQAVEDFEEGYYDVEDPYNGNIKMGYRKNVLWGILDADNPNLAEEFLDFLESNLFPK